ncbi:MAG: zinc ABC transporter substrate-binding protein [Nitrosarchaeum sp.]|nr:zinc ABC transporter substrate-binding protein [Nitrosarchaeum sp.]
MYNQVKLAVIAIAVVIPLAAFSVYASDSDAEQKTPDSTFTVMTSFFPLQEFAEKIGKGKVDSYLLVPKGIEPHDWEPTIQDVQRIQNSDLIVINGIGFESWIDKLDQMNFHGMIVDTSDNIIGKDKVILDEHVQDPHIWLNPIYAKIQVQNIANAFSNFDPKNEKFYQQNANDYMVELDRLDSKIRSELSSCNRDFIAFHDAFSYFADEYGLNQHTIISSNVPHAEPTAKTLENVINTAKKLNVKIIFTEETVDHRTSEIIAKEIGGKVQVLSPIEIGNDKSYIFRMIENLNHLKEALC